MGQLLDYFERNIQPEMDKLEYLQIINDIISEFESGEIDEDTAKSALADIIGDHCRHEDADTDGDAKVCNNCYSIAPILGVEEDEDGLLHDEIGEYDKDSGSLFLYPAKDLVELATNTIKDM